MVQMVFHLFIGFIGMMGAFGLFCFCILQCFEPLPLLSFIKVISLSGSAFFVFYSCWELNVFGYKSFADRLFRRKADLMWNWQTKSPTSFQIAMLIVLFVSLVNICVNVGHLKTGRRRANPQANKQVLGEPKETTLRIENNASNVTVRIGQRARGNRGHP